MFSMIDADNKLFDKARSEMDMAGNDKVTCFVLDVYQVERMLFKFKEAFTNYQKSVIENTLIVGEKILQVVIRP